MLKLFTLTIVCSTITVSVMYTMENEQINTQGNSPSITQSLIKSGLSLGLGGILGILCAQTFSVYDKAILSGLTDFSKESLVHYLNNIGPMATLNYGLAIFFFLSLECFINAGYSLKDAFVLAKEQYDEWCRTAPCKELDVDMA